MQRFGLISQIQLCLFGFFYICSLASQIGCGRNLVEDDLRAIAVKEGGDVQIDHLREFGTTITFKGCNWTGEGIAELKEIADLRSLTFNSCTFSSALNSWLEHLGSLTTLQFKECQFEHPIDLTSAEVNYLLLSFQTLHEVHRLPLRGLRELRLTNARLASSAVRDVENCSNLTGLLFKNCQIDQPLSLLPGKVLDVFRLDFCTGIGVGKSANIRSRMSSLSGLQLSRPLLLQILNSPQIEAVSFRKCMVKDVQNEDDFEWNGDLLDLALDLTDSVFPDSLLSVVLGRPRLRMVTLSGIGVPAKALDRFLEANSKSLVYLDLGDTQIDQTWTGALAKMSKLRFLYVASPNDSIKSHVGPKVEVEESPRSFQLWVDGEWR